MKPYTTSGYANGASNARDAAYMNAQVTAKQQSSLNAVASGGGRGRRGGLVAPTVPTLLPQVNNTNNTQTLVNNQTSLQKTQEVNGQYDSQVKVAPNGGSKRTRTRRRRMRNRRKTRRFRKTRN
jgi:hypothetical protein